jgi:hypothetical protein
MRIPIPKKSGTVSSPIFHAADMPEDFMRDRPMNRPPEDRDISGDGYLNADR